jgi:hypothetical protein
VTHVARHDADVTGLEVEGACGAFAGEDGDARAAFDEKGPFVGVCYGALVDDRVYVWIFTYDANAFHEWRQAGC